MKRLLLALAAVFAVTFASQAQKAEFHIGYGGYTQMDATNCSGGVKTDNAWGAVTAGFNFNVAPRQWVGPSYTFSTQSFKNGNGTDYYHVFMLNTRYQYYTAGMFKLYAKVGLGAMASHVSPDPGSDFTKGYFAYQVVPIGAQAAIGGNAALFGELGFGAQGFLQIGVRLGI